MVIIQQENTKTRGSSQLKEVNTFVPSKAVSSFSLEKTGFGSKISSDMVSSDEARLIATTNVKPANIFDVLLISVLVLVVVCYLTNTPNLYRRDSFLT